MTTFLELVSHYLSSITTSTLIRANWAGDVVGDDFAAMVLLHKLDEHRKAHNPRSMAKYLALWIKGNHGPLTDKAKGFAVEAGLKYNKTHGVGYKHADGTYHWFAV